MVSAPSCIVLLHERGLYPPGTCSREGRGGRDRGSRKEDTRMRLGIRWRSSHRAGQGIGEAYARRFARRGREGRRADVNVEKGHGRRVRDRRRRGLRRVDVASEDDTHRSHVPSRRYGRIDVLLNNAAIF